MDLGLFLVFENMRVKQRRFLLGSASCNNVSLTRNFTHGGSLCVFQINLAHASLDQIF
jgi:hypothetical protein